MKQKLLKSLRLRFRMLVVLLCSLGTGSVWADTVTLTQSSLGLTGSYTTNTEKTIDGITYVYTNLMKNNNNIQAKESTGVIYNKTAFPGNISSVAITHSGTGRSTTISGSSDGTNWSVVNTGSGSITGDFSGKGYKYFKITRGNNAAYWTQIVITYSLPACATPTFSPAAGIYSSAQNVTISTETEGATIYYTTDGSTPSSSNGTAYSSAITVSSTQTIKAIAVKDGNNDSAVASATYTITSAVATTTTIDDSGITNTDVYVNTNAGSFAATVKDNENATIAAAAVTWSSSNTDVATINETTGAVTLVAAGSTTITVSYAGVTDTYQPSSNTYELTVTSSAPYVQPTSVTFNMNYEWLGSSNGSNLNPSALPVVKSQDNVTVTITDGSSTHPRGDGNYIRVYQGSTITFEAPSGYDITGITFTTGGSNTWNAPSVNSGTLSDKTWSGSASSVEFTLSGSCFISSAVVTLTKGKDSPSLTVSPAELSLGYGDTKSFTVSKTGDGTLTVVSNNTSVATVAADETPGQYNVTYVGEGNTTISVTSSETSTYVGDTKTVTITAADNRATAGIAFASASQSAVIAAGTTHRQTLTNPNSLSVTYSSTNTDVATVASDGTVTLKTAGSTTIKATFAGNASYKPVEVSYTLTVTAKYVAELVFNDDEVEKNSTDAPFTNAITTDPDPIGVVYSSSNTSVATVNASTGEVTIVGGGNTTITATINDDDYEATVFTYTLTVNKVTAPISFSSTSATTALDETESFVAPMLNNPQSLTIAYSSSNTSVATVDEGTGAITFIEVGNTTITATSTATAKYNAGEVSYTLTVTKAAETLPFNHSFTSGSGMGDFTTSASGIWTANNTYGAVAQGTTSENWLYSPIINLTDETYATLTFSHATNSVTTPLADNATLWVKEVGGDWTKQTLTYSDNSSWTYVDQTVSLNSFCGKKIQLGFKYISTNTTGKWEIKNLRVADDRVEAPISFATATVSEPLKNKDTYTGQALTNTESLTVSYTSSNTDVASVNTSTGIVTIKAVGETDITASYAETASYKANTATYKLVVTAKAAAAIEYTDIVVSKKITLGTYTHPLTNPNSLTVAYSSSEETVATVNASTGEVTMLKDGETTITATFTEDDDYFEGSASYTLTVIKDDPTLNFAKSSVNVGLIEGTYTQAVTKIPADLPVTYSSSDEAVATVNASTGEATLLKTGSTTITANFAGNASYNSASTTYTLTVVIDYAELPFSYNSGQSDIGTTLTTGTKGFMQSGLGSDYSSSTAPNTQLKFDNTGDYVILKIGETPGILSFNIKGNGFSAGSTSTFKVQTSADGESYSDIASYTELVNETTKSFILAGNVRFVKWIYTQKGSSSGGNVGLGKISLTKGEGENVTVGASGYASYCSQNALDFSSTDVKAYKVKVANGNAKLTEIADGIVPANTGVVLVGAENSYTVPVTTDDPSTDFSDNEMVGVTEETNVVWSPSDGVYNYILQQGTFKKASEDGGKLRANRAYLSTSYDVTSAGVRSLTIVFDDDETGINAIEDEQVNGTIYNLAGQRLNKPQKGINIINGKKVLVK